MVPLEDVLENFLAGLPGLAAGNYELLKTLAVRVLEHVKSGAYGTQLFNALARLTVTPAIEAVCIRRSTKKPHVIEVLLRKRGPDEAYPGQWHCPGSVYRPGETDLEVFLRLQQAEAMTNVHRWSLVGHHNHEKEERGHFVALIFLVEAEEGPGTSWFPVDDLPEPMVEHHRKVVIPVALGAWKDGR